MSQLNARRADRSDREGYWALLKAVPRTVAQHGFRGLTYRAVAREAGVTYGLVSYYFGSRETLIREAASLAADEAIGASGLGSSEGLDGLAAGLADLVTEGRDAQVFQYEITFEALRSDDLLETVKGIYGNYLDTIARTLETLELPSDEPTCRTVLAALDGIVLQQLIYRDPEMTRRSVAALREMLSALAAAGSNR